MTIRTTYDKHEYRNRMKYVCSCGHRMYRVNSHYYTLNPFNRHTVEACECLNRYTVYTQARDCPKCKARMVPLLTQEEKYKVESWAKVYTDDCARKETPEVRDKQ